MILVCIGLGINMTREIYDQIKVWITYETKVENWKINYIAKDKEQELKGGI